MKIIEENQELKSIADTNNNLNAGIPVTEAAVAIGAAAWCAKQ